MFTFLQTLPFLLRVRVLYYLLPSWLFGVVANILLNVGISEPLGVTKELALKGGPFRPFRDPFMAYYPFLFPLVHSVLMLALALALYGDSPVRGWGYSEGVRFSLTVWGCTSLHGIFLDFSTFRISPKVFLSFALGSFVNTLIVGYCLGSFY
jgi:hypothetical protein